MDDLFTDTPQSILLDRIQVLETENKNLKEKLEFAQKETKSYEYLRPDKTFGVSVCGDVLLNKLEVKIVNSNSFQRLRKIKQLGSTFMVYPSANHNRFEHSLGVLKAANTIISNIKDNQHSNEEEKKITAEEEQIIRLLALLHDIGHMPYGHTIEDEFGIFRSHDKHNTRWEYFLGSNSEIGKIIIVERGEEFHSRFFNLIKCEKDFKGLESDAFMYDIVSNTVCADLLDYLERDCFYTNLNLKFHPRFLNFFFITKVKNISNESVEKRIAIRAYKKGKRELRRDIISELIQLLRNRYYLGERVYYHHAKIKTGSLIAGAVSRAFFTRSFEEILITDEELKVAISGNPDDDSDKILYNVHLMGDEDLVNYLKNLKPNKLSKENDRLITGARNLASAFDRREKFYELIYRTKDDLGIEDEFDTEVLNESGSGRPKHDIADKLYNRFIKYGTAQSRLEIEENICEYLEMDSGDLLIYCPHFNMAMKSAKAKIENEKQEIQELRSFNDKSIKEECKSIIDKHQALWALRVFVNPKYVDDSHPEYSSAFEDYKDLIKKYLDWTVLSKDAGDELEKNKIFWDSYINYKLSKFANEDFIINHFEIPERKDKTKELIEDFVSNTLGNRKFTTINEKIINKFNIKPKVAK